MIGFFRNRSLKNKIIQIFILIKAVVLVLQVGVFQKLISTIIMEQSEAFFHETVNQIGGEHSVVCVKHDPYRYN